MIKLFKPNLTDKKSKIFFGIKIAVALIYTFFMVKVFVDKGYYNWTIVNKKEYIFIEPSRIVLLLLIWVVGMVLLFMNINLNKKQNIIASIALSIISIILIFVNTQFILSVGTMGDILGYLIHMRFIHIVFNLFILGTIFLVFYAITNSFKISIYVLAIFSLVISLVNYFVTQFRGTAFIAVDLTNTDTGLSVAGWHYGYNAHLYCGF